MECMQTKFTTMRGKLCMIMDFYKILDFVKKTNPDMTIEKLVDRLGICNYEWKTLNIVKGK